MEAAGGKFGESGDSQGTRPAPACASVEKPLPDAVTGGSWAGEGPIHYLGKEYRYFCHYFWFIKQMCICCLLLRNKPPPGSVKGKNTCHPHNFRSESSGGHSAGWAQPRGSHEAASEGSAGAEAPVRVAQGQSGWCLGLRFLPRGSCPGCRVPSRPAACLLEPVTQEGKEGSAMPRGPFSAGRDSSGRGYREGRVLRGCGM